MSNKTSSWWTIGKKVAGVLLIILGIIGLALPFLQGIALIIAGAVLLKNRWLLEKIQILKKKFTQED